MNRYLILTLLLLSALTLNAQRGYNIKHKFIYTLTYQPDSTDIYSKQTEEMFLLTNNNVSIFQSKNGYIRDSLLSKIENEPTQKMTMLDISKFPKTQFHFKILKDNSKDSIIVYDKIYTDNFRYDELKKYNWKISSDTLTINGLICQKATTKYAGRIYEAWFSDEIPISDGPYKFNGLPGLIVKIYDLNKHYVFELIAKKDANQVYSNLKPKRNLFFTTKSVFFEKLEDYKNNIFERLEQSGFTVDDEYKSGLRQKLKKRNNPIELKVGD